MKNSVRDLLRICFGAKGYTYFRFIITHKYLPNLKKPRSFSEKIIYRKFNVDPNELSKYVDKYTVRDYVKEKIGERYLIPLLLVKDKISIEDFNSLPQSFVIKTSNGGGGNNVSVITDVNSVDHKSICNLFNEYVGCKFGARVDELFYDIENPKIMFETLLSNKDQSPLLDYKFHIFKGRNKLKIFLQINSEYNTKNCTKTLYNLSGNISHIQFDGYSYGSDSIKLPSNFNKMLEVALILSEPFKYSRIDLYNVEGIIYFGEITFCPASGWDKFNNKKFDFLFGDYWNEFE